MRTARSATAIVIGAALTFSVTACGGTPLTKATGARPSATATASRTSAPTVAPQAPGQITDVPAAADNPLGVNWAIENKFTGPAADKFGAANVMAAYRQMVTFTLMEGYSAMLAKEYDATPGDFAAVRAQLTPSAAKIWDGYVKAALAKNKEGVAKVQSLSGWYMMSGTQTTYRFRPGQQVLTVGQDFSSSTASVYTDKGVAYLSLHFTVTRQLRLMKGTQAVLRPFTRDMTYGLLPPTAKGQPWLLDGWTSKTTPGADTPDTSGITD
jgi:hypothetical protein